MVDKLRLLNLDDVEAYIEHTRIESAQSGTNGDPISTPYSKDEPFDADELGKRTQKRWTTDLKDLGWRRTWGVFDDQALVAHIDICGADLRSALHRVSLGMSVLRGHRRQGMGRALLTTAIEWAQSQASIHWIDLGVFVGNDPAIALYQAAGFVEHGRTIDRFRVDGQQVDDISMCLNVR